MAIVLNRRNRRNRRNKDFGIKYNLRSTTSTGTDHSVVGLSSPYHTGSLRAIWTFRALRVNSFCRAGTRVLNTPRTYTACALGR